MLSGLHIFALLTIQSGSQRKFGHPQHPVHRSADLMTHVRQKFTLEPAGLLGVFEQQLDIGVLLFNAALLYAQLASPLVHRYLQAAALLPMPAFTKPDTLPDH